MQCNVKCQKNESKALLSVTVNIVAVLVIMRDSHCSLIQPLESHPTCGSLIITQVIGEAKKDCGVPEKSCFAYVHTRGLITRKSYDHLTM